ncbi:hypothetical protein HGB07_08390, partial [Candidatus Roizmanbacteria bacterium]|nr:hypothetical protein [Candidatus Roizmanbacteria bacterium]
MSEIKNSPGAAAMKGGSDNGSSMMFNARPSENHQSVQSTIRKDQAPAVSNGLASTPDDGNLNAKTS